MLCKLTAAFFFAEYSRLALVPGLRDRESRFEAADAADLTIGPKSL
jgi:hypothetical protein